MSGTKAQVGFGDARVEFCCGRAAGHHHDHGTSRRERSPEREKTGAALIESHVKRETGAPRSGQGERGRARTR